MVRRDIKGFCANKHTRTHTNMCVCFIFSSEKTINHDITSSPRCCSCSISYQSEVQLHLAIFRIFTGNEICPISPKALLCRPFPLDLPLFILMLSLRMYLKVLCCCLWTELLPPHSVSSSQAVFFFFFYCNSMLSWSFLL